MKKFKRHSIYDWVFARYDGSAAQVNAGDVVFQDGVLFLGPDPYNRSRPFPLSLYIGHGDTRPCLYETATPYPGDHDGPRCAVVQNASVSGFEWHDGVCVSKDFFAGLMANGSQAGMLMFEQDFLCATQHATAKDLTTGARWFKAMEDAVSEAGMDLQLCMMNPAHALASTAMPSVSNGRATQDHADRTVADGLPLGWSSLFLMAIGVWPSRDNVWTNSSVKLGSNPKWRMQEAMPCLQTAMAVLTGGPYGPADIAGAMNRSLVMRSCRSDGVLLRPSWPATALDVTFRLAFDTLRPVYLWAARSFVGSLSYVYLLSINLDAPLEISMHDVYPPAELAGGREFAVIEAWHGVGRGDVTVTNASGTIMLPATPQQSTYVAGHSLWFIAPLQDGWAYLGEGDKIIKASHRRVQAIAVAKGGGSIQVRLSLAQGEVAYPSVMTRERAVLTAACTAGADTVARGERSADVVANLARGEWETGHVVTNVFGDVDVGMVLTCTLDACHCVHV